MPTHLGVVELRQYTIRSGRRAEFVALFERNFIEPQNAVGAHLLGIFTDLDDPDRFVWLRGFADMDARRAALEAFYYGPIWRAHRDEANSLMVDSDNVLLLDALPDSQDLLDPKRSSRPGVIRVAIHTLANTDPGSFAAFFGSTMRPLIARAGGIVFATLASDHSDNTFPRLPVREHEPVFVWMGRFPDEAAEHAFSDRLREESGWRDRCPEAVLPALMRKPEVLRLSPTQRSPLA